MRTYCLCWGLQEECCPPPLPLSISVVNEKSLKTLLALICFLSTFSSRALSLSRQYNHSCPLLWFLPPHFPPIPRSQFPLLHSLLLRASLPPCFHSSRVASSSPLNIDWGQRSQMIKGLNQVDREAYISLFLSPGLFRGVQEFFFFFYHGIIHI